MTITYEYLVGNFEELPKVIRSFLDTKWTTVTGYPTKPKILSPDSYTIESTKAYPNGVYNYGVFINEGITQEDEDFHHQSYEYVAYKTDILLDVNMKTPSEASAIIRHINKIFQENIINQTNRVKKSNGTEDSHIAHFKNNTITWTPDRGLKEISLFNGVHYSAIIQPVYFTSKS